MKKTILAVALSALFAVPALAHTSGFNANGSANSSILGGSASGSIGNGEAQGFSDAATGATSNSTFFNNGVTTSTTGAFDSGAKTSGRAASVSNGLGAATASGGFNTGNSHSGW